MRRYQLYLNPQVINTFDEVAEIVNMSRSKLIREAMDAAANRLGNLISVIIAPKPDSYSELDKMTDSIEVKGKSKVKLSENIDEIYYR